VSKLSLPVACPRWFSPGTPASSTTKTGRHDIAEILLKVALNTKNQNQSNPYSQYKLFVVEARSHGRATCSQLAVNNPH
jgi:hypothetical protein